MIARCTIHQHVTTFIANESTATMQRQEPTTELTTGVDPSRLRVTLRLCFAPEQADALASLVACEASAEAEALRPVIRPARLSYGNAQLLSPLGRLRRNSDRGRPLAPRFGLSSDGALALAFHLGLGLEIETLAALLGRSAREISLALHEARQAVEPAELEPCAEFVATIGRYRDPADESTAERLAFMQHVATCGRCRPALEAARSLDERLLDVIAEHERALLPMPKSDRRRRALWLEPTLLWGGMALLLVAVLLTWTIGSHRWLRNETPEPLLSAEGASPPFSGWLLQTSEAGDISAVNVASSERRLLVPSANNASAQTILAPDQQHLAQLITTGGDNAGVSLRVYALDGGLIHEWPSLEQTGQYQLLGWLNASTVLTASRPDGAPRELEHSTLSAFDFANGRQWSLLDSWVNDVLASPDGRSIALELALTNGTNVLQIRDVDGPSLGVPLTTYAQGGSPLAWTKDGRLIFWVGGGGGGKIETLALDGAVAQLAQSATGYFPTTLRLSPDGTQLIYATNSGSAGIHPWTYWSVDLTGGEPRKLIEGNATLWLPPNVIWSPDGMTMALAMGEPFYMPHAAQTGSATSIASYRVVAFNTDGQARGSLLDQFGNQTLLAWLPDDAPVEPANSVTPSNAHTGPFKSVGLLHFGGASELSDDNSLSPDGSRALVYDPGYDATMAIPLSDESFVQVAGPPFDPSWLPDSSGVIGVQRHSDGTSRVNIFGDIGFGTRSVTDYDPVQLGDSTTAAYRYPMLAPDGLHCSFFVVDRQTVTLWVGGYQEPAYTVASWQLPSGAKVDPPLIARWVNSATLIYAEPGNWQNGLTQRVTLHRVTISNGTATDDALIDWQPHGSERGIVLRELRLTTDQSALAIRLRHITGRDPEKDAFDSIEAVDTSDLHQSVELARGTPGNGLSWSPDGTQLVAVIQGKLTVFTIQGGGIEQIDTVRREVSYPLWVLPNEIWYQSGTDTNSQMIRATR